MTETPNTSAVPPREPVLELRLEGIPDELKPLRQWVGWRNEWSGKRWEKKLKRVHGGVCLGRNAKSNTPETWCSFDEAVSAYRARGNPDEAGWLDGIGIALGDNIHGIDLDDCRFLGNTLDDRALEVLRRVDGYAEVSPSGKGIKIFTRTNLTRTWSDPKKGVELYANPNSRWFTTTGHQINGHAALPAEVQDLDWLVEREFGACADLGSRPARAPAPAGPLSAQITLLSNHKAPFEDWPLERVKAELLVPDVLDPAMGYPEWIRVGHILYHQGRGEQEWLDAWDEWSASATGDYVPGLCAEKWETFGMREAAGAAARQVATLGTLLLETKSAREGRASRSAAVLVNNLKAAPVLGAPGVAPDQGTASAATLAMASLGETLKRWRAEIESAAALDGRDAADAELARLGAIYGAQPGLKALIDARDMDAEGLVQTYAKALKKAKGLSRIPSAEARSILTGGPAVLATAQSGEGGGGMLPGPELQAIPQSWLYNAGADEFVNLENGATRSPQGIDYEFKRYMPVKQDGSREPATEWLKTRSGICVVDQMAYHPMGEQVFMHKDKRVGNLYRKTSVPEMRRPADEQDWAAIKAVQNHFEFMLPDARERGLLMSWVAWNVAHPGNKVLWMPFVQGVMGLGKSTLIGLLESCMGAENIGKVSNEALHSEFTGWKMGRAVRALDEVKQRQGGQSAAWSLIEKLREPITDETVTVVLKGQNEFEVPNVTNYIAFSNYRDALPLTNAHEERRLCMLFSPVTAAQVKERVASGEFDRLHRAIAEAGPVLRWWLGSGEWLLGAFEPAAEFNPKGHAPMTMAKQEVAAESQSDLSLLIAEALEMRVPGVGESVVSVGHLRQVLIGLASAQARKVPATDPPICAALRDLGWIPHGNQVRMSDGRKVRAWTLASATSDEITSMLRQTEAGTAVLAG